MLTKVVKFICDDRNNLYQVHLRNGQVFEGWEACRTITTRHKIQGDWNSPQEIFIEKKDVKKLEKQQGKRYV